MKRLTTWILILAAVVVVSGAGYLGFNKTGSGGLDALLKAVGVRGRQVQAGTATPVPATVPVTRGDVKQTVIAPGQLVGTQEIVLETDVSGRLAEISVRPGSVVHKGEVLARLDKAPLQAALDEARLLLERAKAEHARRLTEAKRAVETARLRLEGATTEHTRRLAEAELAVETARVKLEAGNTEHARRLTEAELTLQTAEARLAQARFQYPALTAATVRLENALEAEAEAELEYQEALERQQANWEPEEVAERYRRALEAARDARKIAAAEYNAARGAQSAKAEELVSLEAEIERAKIGVARLQAGVDPLLALELQRARRNLTDLRQAGVDPLLALELEKAQKSLVDLTEAGVDPLLELALQRAQADLEAATVTAPFDSVVLNVRARPGETVARGAELIALADPTAIEARVTVIEEDLPLVEVGQTVEVFFDAVPEVTVLGRVARIVPERVAGEARPLYPVYVALEELPEDLLPGMTVDTSIVSDQRTDVLRLPRALVRAGAGETAQVEVWAAGHAQKRAVKLGLRGDTYIEILDGLREGEQVVGQ